MNVENILKVAEALEHQQIAGLGFNMAFAVEDTVAPDDEEAHKVNDVEGRECGSVACIAGTCHVLRTGKMDRMPSFMFGFHSQAEWLGLEGDQEEELFFATDYLEIRDGDSIRHKDLNGIPLAQAVRVLRNLVITGKVDWKAAEADNDPVLPATPDGKLQKLMAEPAPWETEAAE